MNSKQIQEDFCHLKDHQLRLSHICFYKDCKYKRVICIKCKDDIHNHEFTRLPSILSFNDFMEHINKLVENQSKQYKLYEELISQLKIIEHPCELVNQCLQLLKNTQEKHISTFQICQSRFIKETQKLDRTTLEQLTQTDDNQLKQDYLKIAELLEKIQESGIQTNIKQEQKEQQEQQFILQENNEQKYFGIKNKDQFIRRASISPNGKYLAYYDKRQLRIFKVTSNQCIVNKTINGIIDIQFTDDSRFYFYFDKCRLAFQALKYTQRKIFSYHASYIFRDCLFRFPQVFNEIMIDDNELTIINLLNRQNQQINSDGFPEHIYGIDYDQQNDVIICGKFNKIQFFHKKSRSLLFEFEQFQNRRYIQPNNVKFINNSNYLISGGDKKIFLYIIDYGKQQLYLIKQHNSQQTLQFFTIQGYNQFLVLNSTEIIIFDSDFSIIQKIKYGEIQVLVQVNQLKSLSNLLVCTNQRITIYRKQIQQIDG